VHATTLVEVGLDGRGRSVVLTQRCEAPLLVRCDGASDVLTLLLLGGAAGPVGGDDLRLELRVRDGATVAVRSVAAMLVQPGPTGESSHLEVVVDVGAGACLDWATQPLISVRDSDHRSSVTLTVASSATLRFAEALLLGRHEEAPGRVAARQRLVIDGRAALDHEVVLGVGAPSGPGAHGEVRWMRSEVIVGEDAATEPTTSIHQDWVSGVFPLAPGVSLATAVGSNAAGCMV